ncbi:hypothetical protein HanXRQr2_Chr01g0021101 [Helianthus annuus]|uniref:Uncharacterized protein n=1 Tax=Helianthus annuus TaxID=4232 RepID=A0A9K3P4F7_HELAN|nr:hypothetical protein HanXRQr2_Chr01g0021101 [Helianthus annuus]KAJ0622632.1 hypothetical protein HanIR_Chr01g0022801 [Helianthus annuus]KAJ0626877.1 hypothetical protein HanHA89_Chr01g0018941 [Helianthus annuus]
MITTKRKIVVVDLGRPGNVGDTVGLQKQGPPDGILDLDQSLGSKKAIGLQNETDSTLDRLGTSGPLRNSPGMASLKSDVQYPLLKGVGPGIKGPVKGSGFFDVSKNVFGPGPSPNVNTKNSFGTLQDEEDCFDTDLGLWEHEIEMVKKFVETSTRPKIEEYSSWSENMRKYYDGLTKINGDEAEVESETDEMVRFMKLGSKF